MLCAGSPCEIVSAYDEACLDRVVWLRVFVTSPVSGLLFLGGPGSRTVVVTFISGGRFDRLGPPSFTSRPWYLVSWAHGLLSDRPPGHGSHCGSPDISDSIPWIVHLVPLRLRAGSLILGQRPIVGIEAMASLSELIWSTRRSRRMVH